jgi:hypothetical protein
MPKRTNKKNPKSDKHKNSGWEHLSDSLLLDIENAVADGAVTTDEIAKAIGWGYSKFRTWRDGRRKDGAKESERIKVAIERGRQRQRKVFLSKAENALRRKIDGEDYDETTVTVQETKEGTFRTIKKVNKRVPPDTGAIIFALCNSGKWQQPSKDIKPFDEKPNENILDIAGFDPTRVVVTPEQPEHAEKPDGQ